MPREVVADPRWKRPPKAASRCGTNARHSPPGREPLLDCPEASSKVWTVRKAARRLGEPWKQVGWLLMTARRAGGGGLSGRRSFAQEPLGPCCRALQPLSRRAGGRGAPQPRFPRVEPSEPPQRGWICKPTFEGPAINTSPAQKTYTDTWLIFRSARRPNAIFAFLVHHLRVRVDECVPTRYCSLSWRR